jgi:hypothetical protein
MLYRCVCNVEIVKCDLCVSIDPSDVSSLCIYCDNLINTHGNKEMSDVLYREWDSSFLSISCCTLISVVGDDSCDPSSRGVLQRTDC